MKSIKHKIWLAIIGVCVLIIAAIWISQVVLLDSSYRAEKKDEIIDHTKQIVSLINEKGAMQSAEELKEIASKNNYSIEITELIDGAQNSRMSLQPVGSRSILENIDMLRADILNKLQKDDSSYLLLDAPDLLGEGTCYIGASHQKTDQYEYLVLVGSTLAPVNEAVSTIQKQLIYISVGLILIATIVAFVIARSLTKPILKISNAAKEIAQGNLGVNVTVSSKDEIGRLAEDFNTMSKEIAKASALQRELVANVSHDIRTPLTMIKGYAETIKDLTGDNKEKREEQLDIIIEESNRLNLLVNDILDLSKLQAGQLVLQYTQFDLAKKMMDILKRYDLLTTNEGYHFTLQSPPSVIVYADEVKIEQVIYNLLNNAVNHTGADKQITVVLLDQPDRAVLQVIDTGAGIEKEYLPLIWDRYYKPYKKKDRKGMGTGLGLSIVKGILQAHHFAYGVNSTVGQGSTFWFEVKKATDSEPRLLS
jgi:signal transduction histidine kinase